MLKPCENTTKNKKHRRKTFNKGYTVQIKTDAGWRDYRRQGWVWAPDSSIPKTTILVHGTFRNHFRDLRNDKKKYVSTKETRYGLCIKPSQQDTYRFLLSIALPAQTTVIFSRAYWFLSLVRSHRNLSLSCLAQESGMVKMLSWNKMPTTIVFRCPK